MKKNQEFSNYLNNKVVILKEKKKKQITITPIMLHVVLFILIFFSALFDRPAQYFSKIQIKQKPKSQKQ